MSNVGSSVQRFLFILFSYFYCSACLILFRRKYFYYQHVSNPKWHFPRNLHNYYSAIAFIFQNLFILLMSGANLRHKCLILFDFLYLIFHLFVYPYIRLAISNTGKPRSLFCFFFSKRKYNFFFNYLTSLIDSNLEPKDGRRREIHWTTYGCLLLYFVPQC